MLKRVEIRYGSFWVRLICCLAVALGLVNAVYFNMLEAWEQVARGMAVDVAVGEYLFATRTIEFVFVFLVCIIAAVFRIENPWVMTGYGIVLAAAYIVVVLEVSFVFGLVLPLASPLLGFFLTSMFLGVISWSDERSSRKSLETLEKAKQQFADMLVHDLRGRISSILMSITLVEKKTKGLDDSQVVDLTNTMRLTAERALIQINDLLAIRRIEEGKMALDRKIVPIAGVLEDSLAEHRMACEMIGVNINLKNGDNCKVDIDVNIFARVIANLLWNALEYAPKGSEIEVGYSLDQTGDMALYVANAGKTVPDEKKKSLFNAFVSSRSESLMGQVPSVGLGLAFCKLAVEAHGGSVCLESPWEKTGDGVKVVVSLPSSEQ